MKETEFSRWLFELPAKQHSQFSPSGSTFLPCLSLPSKSHRENSISSIFLEPPQQVDMKNVVRSSKHFFGYFNTLKNSQCLQFNFFGYKMRPSDLCKYYCISLVSQSPVQTAKGFSGDEFELRFPKLSVAELNSFQAKSIQAGALFELKLSFCSC